MILVNDKRYPGFKGFVEGILVSSVWPIMLILAYLFVKGIILKGEKLK